MRAVLTVEMDGAAFGDSMQERTEEFARILGRLRARFRSEDLGRPGEAPWGVFDINDNRVGELRIEDGAPVDTLAAAVLEWARTPGDHGGNPYCKRFVQIARRIAGDE